MTGGRPAVKRECIGESVLQPTPAPPQDTRSGLPFKVLRDYMIVVRATAGESTKLKVQIDTGANFSVVDKRIVRKMGLKTVGRKYRVSAFGKTKTVGRVILPTCGWGRFSAVSPVWWPICPGWVWTPSLEWTCFGAPL
ncbi:MAG: aspartyl protease family protein [Acidobacteriota bacterium]